MPNQCQCFPKRCSPPAPSPVSPAELPPAPSPTETILPPAPEPSHCLYYNEEQQYTAECGEGQTGTPVTKIVPAGTVTSTISQEDANQKAWEQAKEEAESELSCLFYNEEQSYTAYCQEGEIGQPVTVTIPAETYTAATLEEANNIALAAAQEQAEQQLICNGPSIIAELPSPSTGLTVRPTVLDATDDIQLNRDPSTLYNLTIRIRGKMEPKAYENGVLNGTSDADRWYVGGNPINSTWNWYRITVSNPPQTYYINPDPPLVGNMNVRDFTRVIPAYGDAILEIYANSVDMSQISRPDVSPPPDDDPKHPLLAGTASAIYGQFAQVDIINIEPA